MEGKVGAFFKRWKGYILNFLKGGAMGLAILIPGVSGGTMAVIMGIFEPLMEAFSKKNFKKSLPFLLAILAGVVASLLVLSKLIKWLLATAVLATTYFFIGVVLGSCPSLYQNIGKKLFKPGNLIAFAVMLAFMVAMIFVGEPFGNIAPENTHSLAYFVLFIFCGFIASITMIMPGISGSLVMVIFGAYDTVINALASVLTEPSLLLWVLLPFGIGAFFGLWLGVRMMRYLLHKHPDLTHSAILGLIVGSVMPLLENEKIGFSAPGWLGVLTMILGIAVCVSFPLYEKYGMKKKA